MFTFWGVSSDYDYYRIYIQDLSTIAHPLHALVKKDVVWTWSEEAQEDFNTLKEKLSKSPLWEDLISAKSSFYTLIKVLLVLVLFLANMMRKARNMLSPMHPETTTRLRATIVHMKGNVLLLYGPSYISCPIFMAPISFVYQPLAYQVVDDQWQAYW
jgi:hypothetical protein